MIVPMTSKDNRGKIMFNRQLRRTAWGGGAHFMSEFVDYLRARGHEVVFKLEPGIDLMFMLDPRPEEGGYDWTQLVLYKQQTGALLWHRINECDARKGTNDMDLMLLGANRYADETIFISSWLKDYFVERGFPKDKRSHVIYNGCNTDFFYPRPEKDLHRPVRIVTHHWSDNWMKGFDAYKEIDELCQRDPRYEFTYIGRYSKLYQPKATRIVQPLYGKELGDELRQHDIYVTASRWEPCGMHHIEGAASGLPVLYHRDGGGIPEGCVRHGVEFCDSESLLRGLTTLENGYSEFREKIDPYYLSSKNCCSRYDAILEGFV